MSCPAAANGAASVQRAEARGEDTIGLLVHMFDSRGEILEEIDAMT
jgi:hypothetical protein